jgi:hypothetical protein
METLLVMESALRAAIEMRRDLEEFKNVGVHERRGRS